MVRYPGTERLTDSMTGSLNDNTPAELIEFLAKYDPPIHSLALGLRRLVLDAIVPCHEYIFQMRSNVVLLYGPTPRIMADGICQFVIFRRHVPHVLPDGIVAV